MNIISHEEQTKITRAIIKCSTLMLESGAESKLIEQTAQKLGKILGVDSVEISLIPSAIVLSTLYKGQSITSTRRAHHKPINMTLVCDIQTLVNKTKKNNKDAQYILNSLKKIKPSYYNKYLLIFMIGLSCSSLAYLQGADINSFFITFVASSFAMYVRQSLIRTRFNLIITFIITAFVATSIASISDVFHLSQTSHITLASSVLLLVPGFPFINSLLDSVKGYLSMGWGRWLQASLLTLATSIGIILALTVFNIQGW